MVLRERRKRFVFHACVGESIVRMPRRLVRAGGFVRAVLCILLLPVSISGRWKAILLLRIDGLLPEVRVPRVGRSGTPFGVGFPDVSRSMLLATLQFVRPLLDRWFDLLRSFGLSYS
jgi:hypothetical protein